MLVRELAAHHAVNWYLVYAAATVHNIIPLVTANLQRCDPQTIGISPDIWAQFEAIQLRSIALYSGVAVALQKVLAFFAERGIDIMLIKGAALSLLVYAEPWYTLGDVDLVIKSKRRALSAETNSEIDSLFGNLVGFEYDFWAHHDITMNGVLPVNFERIWADAVPTTYRRQPVYLMCPQDTLLALCINSCRKRFARLKSLMDIAEFLARYPDIDWGGFANCARACDCQHIVYAALHTTQQILGTELTEATMGSLLGQLGVPQARQRIIRALACRTPPCDYAAEFAGHSFGGRSVTSSLLLPYATLHWYQVQRRLRFVWDNRKRDALKRLPG
jgi:hypothetical protein